MKKLKQPHKPKPEVRDMLAPVLCAHCHKVYDLGTVKVIARYADCTRFTTPCCGREADDRAWTGAFEKITPEQIATNGIIVDNGTIRRMW